MKPVQFLLVALSSFCFFDVSAQESPYFVFGDNTPTLCANSTYNTDNLKCAVFFKDYSVGFVEFDIKARTVFIRDAKGRELQLINLTPSDITRFTSLDPKAESYPSVSPYVYCVGNPICYTDPTGMYIEEGSIKDWNRMKRDVINQRDKLVSQVENINAKAAKKGWDKSKLQQKLGNRLERVESLNESLATMDVLESSTQGYSLNNIGPNQIGGLTYSPASGLIEINYCSVANFVHEMTHAGQFEIGAIAFVIDSGGVFLQDIYDEVAAYKAQFSFSPSSVSGLVSGQHINNLSDITPSWVRSIMVGEDKFYTPNGTNKTGVISVDIYSSPEQLNRAYPNVLISKKYNILKDPQIYRKR